MQADGNGEVTKSTGGSALKSCRAVVASRGSERQRLSYQGLYGGALVAGTWLCLRMGRNGDAGYAGVGQHGGGVRYLGEDIGGQRTRRALR